MEVSPVSQSLREKVAQLPLSPGVYLYKDAGGTRHLRRQGQEPARPRPQLLFRRQAGRRKTGTLIAEARDVDYILVDNEKEALALENNLIKQYKPRFNILLRDDKTYPYIKLTKRTLRQGVCDAAAAEGRRDLLRPVLSGQPGAPAGALHPPAFSGAFAARWI